MIDKQNSQKFIRQLALVNKLSDKFGRTMLLLFLMVAPYLLIRTNVSYFDEVVPFYVELAVGIASVLYVSYSYFLTFSQESKLICPNCNQRFFVSFGRIFPLSRSEKCQQCGLEIGKIEKAAEQKIPFAWD